MTRTRSRFGGAATVLLAGGVAGVVALTATPASAGGQGTTMTRLFAPVDIGADLSGLPDSERRALGHIIDAARVMDGIFLEQVWAGNPAMLISLNGDRSAAGRAALDYFLLNKGPWARIENDRPFVAGAPPKPEGANYYPAGATRDEVAAWLDGLEGPARADATGFFTTIRRDPAGGFASVPYSLEYEGPLAIAAAHLLAAARATADPSLRRYLETRAAAFASNDYYESDVAWMELDSAIEPTIGPYEVYEDEWFNYKAAFEAFVTIRDAAETATLERFGAELQGLEDTLPIDPRFRNPALGALAPIRVVNVVFTAGDANSGVQTAAFNLPNDERVVREKGSKRVMLKNVQEAKFQRVLTPIAQVTLRPAEQREVSFEAFFTHILMHELMHGLGPGTITVGGRRSTVRQQLRETYSTIEEAKADVAGLWALRELIDRGVVDVARAQHVHHVPRLDVPLDPLRHRRGARPRRGHPAQHVPRRRRRGRRRRRAFRHRPRPHPRHRHRPHPRAHDGAGHRRPRRRAADSGDPGGRDSRGAAGAGPARAHPHRHPAPLRHRRGAGGCRPVRTFTRRRDPISARAPADEDSDPAPTAGSAAPMRRNAGPGGRAQPAPRPGAAEAAGC